MMELKKNPSFTSKRPILVTQKTNIKFDLDINSIHSNHVDHKIKNTSMPKLEKSVSRLHKDKDGQLSSRNEVKNEYIVPQVTIEQFLEKSVPIGKHLPHQDSGITRARVIEEMYRINQRANISSEERKQLYQIAVTMDAPKLARKLVIDAKELHSESLEGFSFLTGNLTGPSHESHSSEERRVAEEDELFCKAFDEVERIRLRIFQRAALNSPAPTPLPAIESLGGGERKGMNIVRTYSLQKLQAESDAQSSAMADFAFESCSPKATSPKHASSQKKFFDKPLMMRKGSGREFCEADKIASDIDSLLGSRPSSGRRSSRRSSRASSDVFGDPFLRPRDDQRKEDCSQVDAMVSARQELLKAQHSTHSPRVSSFPRPASCRCVA